MVRKTKKDLEKDIKYLEKEVADLNKANTELSTLFTREQNESKYLRGKLIDLQGDYELFLKDSVRLAIATGGHRKNFLSFLKRKKKTLAAPSEPKSINLEVPKVCEDDNCGC